MPNGFLRHSSQQAVLSLGLLFQRRLYRAPRPATRGVLRTVPRLFRLQRARGTSAGKGRVGAQYDCRRQVLRPLRQWYTASDSVSLPGGVHGRIQARGGTVCRPAGILAHRCGQRRGPHPVRNFCVGSGCGRPELGWPGSTGLRASGSQMCSWWNSSRRFDTRLTQTAFAARRRICNALEWPLRALRRLSLTVVPQATQERSAASARRVSLGRSMGAPTAQK